MDDRTVAQEIDPSTVPLDRRRGTVRMGTVSDPARIIADQRDVAHTIAVPGHMAGDRARRGGAPADHEAHLAAAEHDELFVGFGNELSLLGCEAELRGEEAHRSVKILHPQLDHIDPHVA